MELLEQPALRSPAGPAVFHSPACRNHPGHGKKRPGNAGPRSSGGTALPGRRVGLHGCPSAFPERLCVAAGGTGRHGTHAARMDHSAGAPEPAGLLLRASPAYPCGALGVPSLHGKRRNTPRCGKTASGIPRLAPPPEHGAPAKETRRHSQLSRIRRNTSSGFMPAARIS